MGPGDRVFEVRRLHREPGQEVGAPWTESAPEAQGVLVDQLPRRHGRRLDEAVAARTHTGGDGTRRVELDAVETERAAEGAAQLERVTERQLADDVPDHARGGVEVADLGRVGHGVLHLLAEDRRLGPVAVAVAGRERRIELHGGEDAVSARAHAAVLDARRVAVDLGEAEARRHAEARADVGVQVEAHPVALEVRPDFDAVLLHIVPAEQVPHPIAAAGQCDRPARLRRGDAAPRGTTPEHHGGVVIRLRGGDLRGAVGELYRRGILGGVEHRLVPQLHVLGSGQDGDEPRDPLEPVARLYREMTLARPAALGGNQHHAVRAPRAIDRLGGRVLQHIDRLYRVGIDGHERIALGIGRRGALLGRDAVDDVQRLAVRGERVGATDTHARPDTRHAGVAEHLHARRPALQRRIDGRRWGGPHGDGIAAHRGHGPRQVPLLNRGVADGYHCVELDRLGTELKVDGGGRGGGHDDAGILDRAVPDEAGSYPVGAWRHADDQIPAVRAGDGAQGSARQGDAGARQGSTGLLGRHRAGDPAGFLGQERVDRRQRQGR